MFLFHVLMLKDKLCNPLVQEAFSYIFNKASVANTKLFYNLGRHCGIELPGVCEYLCVPTEESAESPIGAIRVPTSTYQVFLKSCPATLAHRKFKKQEQNPHNTFD